MGIADLLIGAGAGSIIVAVVNAFINRRKLGADTASVLSKAAIDLVQPLRDRIHELEAEVDELRTKVKDTVDQLDACQASNRAKDRELATLRPRETP